LLPGAAEVLLLLLKLTQMNELQHQHHCFCRLWCLLFVELWLVSYSACVTMLSHVCVCVHACMLKVAICA
jgi:hypothetical protein